MKVAVPREKHSPMLGHLALWQTVFMPKSSSSRRKGSAFALLGTFSRIHSGNLVKRERVGKLRHLVF